MDKDIILSRLIAAVGELPSGAMGGGLHLAASRIVEGLQVLSGPAIVAAIAEEADNPRPGPLGEWMKTLPGKIADQ